MTLKQQILSILEENESVTDWNGPIPLSDEKKAEKIMELINYVDHSVDVRYEPDLEKAFNKFIYKWCGTHCGHLIDNDENDGEFIRQKIRKKLKKENK